MIINYKHDKEADAIYMQLTKEKIGVSRELDEDRVLDIGLFSGEPVGIELLNVSGGVRVDYLPCKQDVKKLLIDNGIKINE